MCRLPRASWGSASLRLRGSMLLTLWREVPLENSLNVCGCGLHINMADMWSYKSRGRSCVGSCAADGVFSRLSGSASGTFLPDVRPCGWTCVVHNGWMGWIQYEHVSLAFRNDSLCHFCCVSHYSGQTILSSEQLGVAPWPKCSVQYHLFVSFW